MATYPITPSKSKTSTSVSTRPKNNSAIRSLLYDQNLFMYDDDAFESYKEIRNTAFGLIDGERNSAIEPGSRDNFRKVRKSFAIVNELTFLVNLWACLLHKTREVERLEAQEKVEWIQKAWDLDHLGTNWSADFLRDSIPPIQTDDPVFKKLFREMPRVENPRPDLAFGLRVDAFNRTERHVNHILYRHAVLSQELFHIWFIVEVKSAGGTIEDAENQCCRGGAAMVNARMKFNAEAPNTIGLSLGADLQSIAFSLAVAPGSAQMFVHWAEIKETETKEIEVVFHMNFLRDYSLKDHACDGFAQLRHDIDNVLDWGTLKRQQKIKDVCKQISQGIKETNTEEALQAPATKKRGRVGET